MKGNLISFLVRRFNLIKNAIQFTLGSIFYFLTFGTFNFFNFLIGLIGFLIAYHSVYQFNDLIDYEEDRKNKIKIYYKPLPSREINRKHIESYSFLFMLVGLAISFSLNIYFGLLISFILFLNFLHSSPFTRLKKSKFLVLPNLFIIEAVKYSLGWLVMSFSLLNFPFFLIIGLSTVYLAGYIYCKQNINNFFKSNRVKFLIIVSIILYLISFLSYSFKLALLLPLPVSISFLFFRRISSAFTKIDLGVSTIYITALCFIFSMLLLNSPVVAEFNNNINKEVNNATESITKIIPESIKSEIISLNKTIADNIMKIDEIKEKLKNPFER